MKTHHIEATALIHAPAERVYAILADYHDGHGRIAPKPWFGPIEVEQGGTGAGTIIRFTMTVLGKTQACRSIISEPEPGRVMVENENSSGTVTTFTVIPIDAATSQTTIASEFKLHAAPISWIEPLLLNRAIPPIYAKELQLLDDYASKCGSREAGPSESSISEDRALWRPRLSR